MSASARLAAFVGTSRNAALPAEVLEAGRRAFTNWMGCALGAVEEASVRQVREVVLALAGSRDASMIGRSERVDPVNAALLNGVAANALDYDDMHAPTLIHPTGPVVAAALALSESRRTTGAVLLSAIVAGIEVECRLGLALFPEHYDAGWHITATLGTFGATAASSVVLDLDERRIQHALGIASTLAGGLRSMLSNACKSLNIGRAASAGVTAALLAKADLQSDPRALEVKHGFFDAFGAPRNAGALVRALGSPYLITQTSFKPYPCGIVIHPLIDACIALARPGELSASHVSRVVAAVHPRAIELADRQHPANALEGRYSLQHAAALAFTRGSAGLADFDDARVDDPELKAWRDVIEVTADPQTRVSEARVVVELKAGQRLEHAVRHASGSPERPLTDAQLERKFMELACRALDRGAAERLYGECLAVDGLREANELRRHWAAAALT